MAEDVLRIDTRRQRIIELVQRTGKVRVSDLSKDMQVSAVTIRNDLKILEINGQLERVPGGAIVSNSGISGGSLPLRKTDNAESKKKIAAAAVNLIQDGETLFINSGFTALFTAMELRRLKNINIVTNSVAVALELGSHPTFRVILLGGRINTQYAFIYGSDALAQLGRYKADKSILSVDGVCPDMGLTTYHAEEAEINRLMIQRASKTIIVADSSKLGRESFNNFSPLTGIEYLVTDNGADDDLLSRIRRCDVDIILA